MADFQNNLATLRKAEASVIALSVDALEEARELAGLTGALYPIVYGLDAAAVQQTIGGYMNPDPPFLQPSNFILRPDGTVALAAYSSSQIPRLRAGEAAAFIESVKRREAKGAG